MSLVSYRLSFRVDPEAYELLGEHEAGHPGFDRAVATADAVTLLHALSNAWEQMLDGRAVVDPIHTALMRRHGLTDDEIQAFAHHAKPPAGGAYERVYLADIEQSNALNPDPISMPDTSHPSTILTSATQLADHPLLAHIPVWGRAEPEFQALLDNIATVGQLDDVLVDSTHRVVDGRNRRNALSVLNRPVRCRVVADEDVAQIVLGELATRRHLTKGALAYLCAPLMKPAVDEARDRKLAMLRQGESPSSSQKTTGTAEDLAASFGFGRNLLFQSLDLHKKFEAKPELREQFEGRILSGELGLGAALQAIAGKEATEGKAKPIRQVDTLIERAFGDLRNRFAKWDTLAAPKRDEVTAKIVTAAAEWPADVAKATAAAWKKQGLI